MNRRHDLAPPVPTAEPVLSLRGIGKTYDNGFTALESVDLTVGRGEIVSLVGPSGCGKTTVIRIAAGLTGATSGALERASDKIAYVFQEPTLLPWKSVRGNVEQLAKLQHMPAADRAARATDAIRAVGLERFERSLPGQLSGGQKMRVSLARALAARSDLMLMDEPFAALDEFTREGMQLELLRLWRENAFGVVFITHSIREAVMLGHRIVVMGAHPGRILEVIASPYPPSATEGPPRERAEALRDVELRVSELLATRMEAV